MKLRHIVLFLLVTGVALLTVAMPVSAQLDDIDEGDTVFIGETGLDITDAVDAYNQIAWWAPGLDVATDEPSKILPLSLKDNFEISPDLDKFGGRTGNWYRYDGSEQGIAFIVQNPSGDVSILNLKYATGVDYLDVTGSTVIYGDENILDFKVKSDLYLIQERDPGETFNFLIEVKNSGGVKYSKLWTTSIQKDLTDLELTTNPWYWSTLSGTIPPNTDGGWYIDARDPITEFLVYTPGTYEITIKCNQNGLGYVGATRTVTLEEEQPVLTVDPSSLIRGEKFTTTITGLPNTTYVIWIKDCVACPNGCCTDRQSGSCCDEAPWIVPGQEGVLLPDQYSFDYTCDGTDGSECPPCYCDGPFCDMFGDCESGQPQSGTYYIGDTLIHWCGCLCTETLEGIMPEGGQIDEGRYPYALIRTDEDGVRTIEWQTWTCTKPSSYLVHTQRWIFDDVCELDLFRPYAEACVNVNQGVVTINTDVCDEPTDTSYLGETVHIYGTNTDSAVTYLFITGPCQHCEGDNMTITNAVVNGDATTFTKVPVKSDGTWEYYWYTRNLQIDLGQYTIYAASMPNDAPALEGVPCNECEDVGVSCAAWAKKPFTFLEPSLTADVNPKVIQIVCCSGPSIIVDGDATGLRGEAIGQQYNTVPLGIWVFGENKVAGNKYIFDVIYPECSTGEFEYDLKDAMDTLYLLPGTYTVVVQHPMYNHRLDILPETSPNEAGVKWICDQSDWCPWLKLFESTILQDEVWYPDINRKFVVTATPIRWSKLFVIDGPDRLAGTAALNALLAGFNDPNIDDQIVTLQFKVESNNALQAGFSGIPTSGGAPLSVKFTDISIGYPTTWAWDFGDGYTSTEQNPLHVYENAGTYAVTLTVTGATGTSSITKNDYVTVTTGPTPTGTVTTTPTAPPVSTINLNTGWNFISTPKALADSSRTAGVVFAGVNTGGRSIYYYNAETMSWQALNAESIVKPLDGIWIYSTSATPVPLTYKNDPLATPPTKQLFAGWNSIGFTDVNPAAAKDTLQSVNSQWTLAIGFNSASQLYDNSIIKGATTGSHAETNPMNPFKGYWLFMNAPGTLAAISA